MQEKYLKHLYLRAGFGLAYTDFEKLKNKSKEQILNQLFQDVDKTTPLKLDLSELDNLFADKTKPKTIRKKTIRKFNKKKVRELNSLWFKKLTAPESVLSEKMTLFWANIFVCKDKNAHFILQYNNILRKHALGNFKEFVQAIAKEPAMMRYLNLKQNIKESPNENFARELMELFTLGVGNYTEKDIKESARAFTGWSFKRDGSFYIKKKQHDFGEKEFFGQKGHFNGDDIIEIITQQKQCARYICKRVYTYFVNPVVDKNHLEELTDVFYKDYDIKKLMFYVFNSDWFYDAENIGVKIKSPIELLVGIHKTIPFKIDEPRKLILLQKMMNQVLLSPPNVAGWKTDKNWINSNTISFRLNIPAFLLNGGEMDLNEKGDFTDDFKSYYKKNIRRFKDVKVDWTHFKEQTHDLSKSGLKAFLIISEINPNTYRFLENQIMVDKKNYCLQLMSIPEYQLC